MINNVTYFKEYDEFIAKHKNNMDDFIIYYNLKCNSILNFEELDSDTILEYIQLIWLAYRKDEQNLDLNFICNTLAENKDIALKENWKAWDLLQECYKAL